MQSIIDAIEQWLKDFLIGAITGNLSSMFSDVNSKVATIATEVGKTPESWNSSVFSIILTLSRNVVVPIAGLVIAAVLTYELISMIIEKNNMHDIDTFMFFKWAFKSAAAAIIVNHDALHLPFDDAPFGHGCGAGRIGQRCACLHL